MLSRLIQFSLSQRLFMVLATLLLTGAALWCGLTERYLR